MKRIIQEHNLTVTATIAMYLMAYEFAGTNDRVSYFDLRQEPGRESKPAPNLIDQQPLFLRPRTLSTSAATLPARRLIWTPSWPTFSKSQRHRAGSAVALSSRTFPKSLVSPASRTPSGSGRAGRRLHWYTVLRFMVGGGVQTPCD